MACLFIRKNHFLLLLLFFLSINAIAQNGSWTWVKGDPVNFGTTITGISGVADDLNMPQSRYAPTVWTDNNGNFWMWGGSSEAPFPPIGTGNHLIGDLWKYNPNTNQWTYYTGETGFANSFHFGTIGIPSPLNSPPPTQYGSPGWVDINNNLWLYGTTDRNDMWMFNTITFEWTWMSGDATISPTTNPVYGVQGVFSPNNSPGVDNGEFTSGNWVDQAGNLWYFRDDQGIMWKYDPIIKQWAWITGISGSTMSYTSIGSFDPSNTPGVLLSTLNSSLELSWSKWKDKNGNFWLMITKLNGDTYLWQYNVILQQWACMWFGNGINGSEPFCEYSSTYAPHSCVEYRVNWVDDCNNFWFLAQENSQNSNDTRLWCYNSTINQFKLIQVISDGAPVYGTMGVSSPLNKPGNSMWGLGYWGNTDGIWIFQGGYGDFDNSIWLFEPDSIIGSFTFSSDCLSFDFIGDATTGCNEIKEWKWDFGDGSTSNIQNPTHLFSASGNYDVSLIVRNCTWDTDTIIQTIVVISCDSLNASDDIICEGDTANIQVFADFGTAPYTYAWSGGILPTAGPHSVSPTITTEYYVTVTDITGTSMIDTATVTVNSLPIVDLGIDTNLCASETSFLLDAENSGCMYLWNDNSTNQTLSVTTTNMYSVTVTDNNECSSSDTINVLLGVFTSDVSISNVSCNSGNNGEIDLSITAGLSPFTYSWSNLATTEDVNNLVAGDYFVTVTDDIGCQMILEYEVTQPEELSIEGIQNNLTCYQNHSGVINITVSGGTAPYTYIWSDSAITEGINNLDAGIYTVSINDANNCTTSQSFTLTEPLPITTNINPTNLLCYSDENGEADITITGGGTSPYTYLWSNAQTTQNITGLIAGEYSVTITDANNCTATNSVTISGVGTPLEATLISTNLLCFGDDNASAKAFASGATPPYTYIWNTGTTGSETSNLVVGNYTVTVIDNNNCKIIKSIGIIEPSQLEVNLPADFYICQNPEETILSDVTGGIEPYNYQWSTGAENESITISPNEQTQYTLTVSDANNCTATNQVTVKVYEPISLIIESNRDTVCEGESVLINASISGGNPPYTITTLDNQIISLPQIVNPVDNQTYTYIVKGKCFIKKDSITLYNYPTPQISFSADILKGCEPLKVQFNNVITCDKCTYKWLFDDVNEVNLALINNPLHIFTQEGIYDITLSIVNKYGCTNSHTSLKMINVYSKPEAMFEPIPEIANIIKPEIYYSNLSQGAISYNWLFGDGYSSLFTNPTHKFSDVGEYITELVVVSEYNCRDTARFAVIIQDKFTLYVPTAFTPDGDGINDGFRAVGYGIDEKKYYIAVFDRWGEPIWESTNLYEEWDARVKKGNKIVQNGTYTWVIISNDLSGIKHEKSGNVNVIR